MTVNTPLDLQSGPVYVAADGTIYFGKMKSRDAGSTWTAYTQPPLPIGGMISGMTLAPTDASVIYAFSQAPDSLFRSADAGQTWSSATVPPGGFSGIFDSPQVDVQNAGLLYIATPQGFFASTDGGNSWTSHSSGIDLSRFQPNTITQDRVNPDIFYVGAAGAGGTVFQSQDHGNTWSSLQIPDGPCYVDGTNDMNVICGTAIPGPIERTQDGGHTWSALGDSINSDSVSYAFANTSPQALFAALIGEPENGKNLYKSLDLGNTYAPKSSGMTSLCGWSSATSSAAPGAAYVITAEGGGLYQTTDGGDSWTAALPDVGTGNMLAVDVGRNDGSRIVAAANLGVLWSSDGGNTWSLSPLPPDGTVFYSVAISPSPGVVFGGSLLTGSVYKSVDNGQSWSQLATVSTVAISHVAVNPSDPNEIYAGTVAGTDAGLYRSRDGGISWSHIEPSSAAGQQVRTMSFDDQTPATLYAGIGTQVFSSADGGSTWSVISIPLPLQTNLDRFISRGSLMFQFYDQFPQAQIYVSLDKGGSWAKIPWANLNPGSIYLNDIAVDVAGGVKIYGITTNVGGIVYK
jgi:photosystem II stability/assembly factor-like uncharacterized protein